MGQSTSSLRNIENDYELVIRVSKMLEQKLKDDFDLDGSLSQMLTELDGYIEDRSLRDMKQLVWWRNQLVHDTDIHSLSDLGTSRLDFNQRFERALGPLRQCNHPGRRRQIMPGPYSDIVQSSPRNATTKTIKLDEHLGGWGLLAAGVLAAGGIALAAAAAENDGIGGGYGSGTAHTGINCDACGTRPIRGARYKCNQCPNFDLCSDCWNRCVPPSCGHVTFLKKESPDQSWRVIRWCGYKNR